MQLGHYEREDEMDSDEEKIMTTYDLMQEVFGYVPDGTPAKWENLDADIERVTGRRIVSGKFDDYREALLFMQNKALAKIRRN